MPIYVIIPEYFSDVCIEVLREPMADIGLHTVVRLPGAAVRFCDETRGVFVGSSDTMGVPFPIQLAFEVKADGYYWGAPYHWFKEEVPGAAVSYQFSTAADLKENLMRMFNELVMDVGIIAPGGEAELRDRVRGFYLSIGGDLDW